MPTRSLAIVIASAAMAAAISPATASETFSFPSANGVHVVKSKLSFGNQGGPLSPHVDGAHVGGPFYLHGAEDGFVPLPAPTPYDARFGKHSREADAYAYRFLTHALAAASYANYAADYYRLFAPSYAVNVWTDRVGGLIEAGYGGAVDSWTAGAYYLGRVRGPMRRRETPPDLNVMPKFGPHPELDDVPTFAPSD